MCYCPVIECPMKLVLVILVVFCGHVTSTTVMVGPTFENINELKTRLNEEKRMIQHVIAYIHKKEEMLNLRLHELNYKKFQTSYPTVKKDEIEEQSLVVVKTKTTTERGKRFIPRGPSLTPCLLKICTMGKKMHYIRH